MLRWGLDLFGLDDVSVAGVAVPHPFNDPLLAAVLPPFFVGLFAFAAITFLINTRCSMGERGDKTGTDLDLLGDAGGVLFPYDDGRIDDGRIVVGGGWVVVATFGRTPDVEGCPFGLDVVFPTNIRSLFFLRGDVGAFVPGVVVAIVQRRNSSSIVIG